MAYVGELLLTIINQFVLLPHSGFVQQEKSLRPNTLHFNFVWEKTSKKMNIGEIEKDDALYKQALALRYDLLFKKHGLPQEVMDDERENECTHIAISSENELVAYGRLLGAEHEEFQISQIVVAPKYQSQGYGTKLLIEIMETAKRKGAKTFALNARTTAAQLYKKLGFQQIGSVFESHKTGILYIKMVYHVDCAGDK